MRSTAFFSARTGGIAFFAFLAATQVSCVRQHSATAIASPKPDLAYVAVRRVASGESITIYYDRGRYSEFGDRLFYIYDGTDSYLRWTGDTKKRTAQLDAPLPEKRLFQLIQQEGVDLAARKSGIDRSVLTRFARLDWLSPPRVFAHPLPIVASGSPAFQRLYQNMPDENVAGHRCAVFLARDASGDRIWVEPMTHCVLREHKTFASGNPRVPASVWDWEVHQFTQVLSVDPKHFHIPPGTTVILPRILSDLPLPPGVHRKLLEGENSYTGGNVGRLVENIERRLREQKSFR